MTLTLSEKIRLHSTVLRVPLSYQLPVQETTKQKYYLRHHHLSGSGNVQYEHFYFSPELQGVLCLACLLYAPDKVGVGNQSKLGVLVETLLTNFKKIREIYNSHLFQAKYHQNAVQEINQVEVQETTAVGDISHQLKTQQAEEVANNKSAMRLKNCSLSTFAVLSNSLFRRLRSLWSFCFRAVSFCCMTSKAPSDSHGLRIGLLLPTTVSADFLRQS